jgi:hypothetical protein
VCRALGNSDLATAVFERLPAGRKSSFVSSLDIQSSTPPTTPSTAAGDDVPPTAYRD